MAAFIKHRPTVLDQLPLEVIRTYIFPHLNYEERINLNQCLPVWDRITKKMDMLSMEKHEQGLLVQIIKGQFDEQDALAGTLKIKSMIKMFRFLQQDRAFVIIKGHTGFRQIILAKIKELVQSLVDLHENVELGVRLKLASELKKLRNKIDVSGLYTDRNYKDVPQLSFV